MPTHTALRQQLEARLGQILARVGRIEGDLRRTHDRDSQEAAIEIENDEVLEGLDDMSRSEVGEIRTALRRMVTGQYGLCSQCGQEITADRLAAVPTASKCIVCAQ